MRRGPWIAAAVTVLIWGTIASVIWLRPRFFVSPERLRVEACYTSMVEAMARADTNAAALFIAPSLRREAIREGFDRLQRFAKRLDKRSRIWMFGDSAVVTPEPDVHFGIIPGGHGIELVKTNGAWFFTGKILID